MKDGKEMLEDFPVAPMWLAEGMHTHQTLSRRFRTIIVAAMLFSAVLMCVMPMLMWGYGSRRLVVNGVLAGLWLGAFCASVLWVFVRPSDVIDVPAITIPGLAAVVAGVFMGPKLLLRDIRHWRYLTSTLRANRNDLTVARYLDGERSRVISFLSVALVFYLAASVLLAFVR